VIVTDENVLPVQTKFCRTCGNQIHENAVACPKCGVPPKIGKAYCYACGSETRPEAIVCVKCSQALDVLPVLPTANATTGSQDKQGDMKWIGWLVEFAIGGAIGWAIGRDIGVATGWPISREAWFAIGGVIGLLIAGGIAKVIVVTIMGLIGGVIGFLIGCFVVGLIVGLSGSSVDIFTWKQNIQVSLPAGLFIGAWAFAGGMYGFRVGIKLVKR